jgi:hypothetical protein
MGKLRHITMGLVKAGVWSIFSYLIGSKVQLSIAARSNWGISSAYLKVPVHGHIRYPVIKANSHQGRGRC